MQSFVTEATAVPCSTRVQLFLGWSPAYRKYIRGLIILQQKVAAMLE